jgi:hypothetical protein
MVLFDQIRSIGYPFRRAFCHAANMASPAIQDAYENHSNDHSVRGDHLELCFVTAAIRAINGTTECVRVVMTSDIMIKMKKIRQHAAYIHFSFLSSVIFILAYGFHGLHHITKEKHDCELCVSAVEVPAISTLCVGPCDDSKHHHHHDSSSEHSGDCLICLGTGIVYHQTTESFLLLPTTRKPIVASFQQTVSSIFLSSASPRGPPQASFSNI